MSNENHYLSIDELLNSFPEVFEKELENSMKISVKPSEGLLKETEALILKTERLQNYDLKQIQQKKNKKEATHVKIAEELIPILFIAMIVLMTLLSLLTLQFLSIIWVKIVFGTLISMWSIQFCLLSFFIKRKQKQFYSNKKEGEKK